MRPALECSARDGSGLAAGDGSGPAAGMDGIVSTSPGSEPWNGSGRANGGLGRGKEPGGNCGSGPGAGVSGPENGGLRGVGVWGLGV